MSDGGSTVRADALTSESPLRVAVIGVGEIARAAHLPAWQAASAAEVTCLVDINGANAKAAAKEHRITRWETDVSAVLDGSIDAVDICLPPSSHFEVAKRCLEAGLHVLVEKPVTLTLQDALALQEVATPRSRILMVAENWLFASASRCLAALLNEERLGRILSMRVHHETSLCLPSTRTPGWVDNPKPFGGGYMINAGIHSISLVQSLVGELVEVQAFAHTTESGSDHEVVATARSQEGALVSFYFTGYSRHLGERRLGLRAVASGGVAEIDLVSGTVEWTIDGEENRVRKAAPSMGFREEVEHFIQCVLGGIEPRTGLASQSQALAVVHAIYQSIQDHEVVRPSQILAEAGLV